MAEILIVTSGSLGDLHPKIALGLELRTRGHQVSFCTHQAYREKFAALGFRFYTLRPHLDHNDRELARKVMDLKTGSEYIFKEILLPNLRPMYEDVTNAAKDKDLLVSGEVVLPVKSVVEKSGIKWVSTSLAPISFMSTDDPSVYPTAEFLENLRFMPKFFHQAVLDYAKKNFLNWFAPYEDFRRELGLNPAHDPMFGDKFSAQLHLAMFSKVLAVPQSDWAPATVQTGFCFYDGQDDLGSLEKGLEKFLDEGEPPLVFTLGSAAVMDARDFYEQSIAAAKILGKRAVLLYGLFNEPPEGLDEQRVGFNYAPFSQIFPRAAAVVHQGGIGTTSQALRAGVPMLVMPYSHDQPDNAARCRRLGVGEIISRDAYNAEDAARKLDKLLTSQSYKKEALEVKEIIAAEGGTALACDQIEKLL